MGFVSQDSYGPQKFLLKHKRLFYLDMISMFIKKKKKDFGIDILILSEPVFVKMSQHFESLSGKLLIR